MTETERHPGGRPEWEPTDEDRNLVRMWAGQGVTQAIIAGQLGVAVNTLTKHCRAELDEGLMTLAQQLLSPAMQVAKDPTHDAFARLNIFFLKTHLGMTEVTRTELTGKDGGPLEPPILEITFGNHESQSGPE